MDKNKEESIQDPRIYEVGYLLLPNLAEEEIPAVYTTLKDSIVSLGGEVISDEMPKLIPLAYTMFKVNQNVRNKFDSAYFGWVKFQLETEKIAELKKKITLDSNYLRFLIIKTVRENTIATKRFVHRDSKRKISPSRENEEAPIDEKEIDKEIDAMVAA